MAALPSPLSSRAKSRDLQFTDHPWKYFPPKSRGLFNFLPLRIRKLHLRCSHILLQMLHRRRPRNRNHHRRMMQQPRQRKLHHAGVMFLSRPPQPSTWLRQFPRRHRIPRDKPMPFFSQYCSAFSCRRSLKLYWFCTLTILTVFPASSICAGVTSAARYDGSCPRPETL